MRWTASALLLLALPVLAAAQQEGSCAIDQVPGRRAPDAVRTASGEVYVSGRALYRCPNNVRFLADSAVSVFSRRILIGNVNFEDAEKTVLASRLEYDERQGLIVAQGDVTVVDKKTGNRLRAPQGVTYNRVSRTTPEATINVYSGRPHITIFRGEGANRDTTDVDADRMQIIGERLFHGTGNVIIKRGALQATGGEAKLMQNGEQIALWRTAHIKGDNYELRADSIYGETESDEFRDLRAFRTANLTTDDIRVNSGWLRIMLDSGVVNRLIAVGGINPAGAENLRQANVLATDFNLIADSIDALAPNQKIEQVTAVGNAMGARMPDSLDRKLPDMVQRDWLRGDTVIANFTEAPDSVKQRRTAQNDTAFDRVLEKLVAAGSSKPATALYRMREKTDTTNTPQINYIAAKRIVAVFKDGAVHDVDAQDQIKGVYLQPKAVVNKPPGEER